MSDPYREKRSKWDPDLLITDDRSIFQDPTFVHALFDRANKDSEEHRRQQEEKKLEDMNLSTLYHSPSGFGPDQ